MLFVRIIDGSGNFLRDDFVDELTEFTIETPCPDGFYLPRWDGEKWVEGKTAEEIAAIQAEAEQTPATPSLEELAENLNTAMMTIMLLSIE